MIWLSRLSQLIYQTSDLSNIYSLQNLSTHYPCRDHFFVCVQQWETTLHCNVVSHWLHAYKKMTLVPDDTTLAHRTSPIIIITWHKRLGFSNHWHLHCLFFRYFRVTTKKRLKIIVFFVIPSQKASNAEIISMSWRQKMMVPYGSNPLPRSILANHPSMRFSGVHLSGISHETLG